MTGQTRVLFVAPSLKGGGAERVLVTLLRHFDLARFEPVLVTFFEGNDYKQLLPEGLRLIPFQSTGRLAFPRLCLRLARTIREERPALIVSFMNYGNLISIMAARWAGGRVPVVITEHTPLSLHFDGRHSLGRRCRGWLAKRLYPAASAVVAVSDGLRRELIERFGVSSERCHAIANPVDLDLVRKGAAEPLPADFPADGLPLVTTCGRLEPLKNQALLMEAFADLQAKHPARLLVIGDGSERGRLEQKARELGIADRTLFLGFQANPFRFMAASAVFVLTSNWEGFGNVLVEAMACGVPVISSDCDHGPREIVQDCNGGLLFPVGDRSALASRMDRLLGDTGLRARLTEAGRRSSIAFEAGAITRRYEKLLQSTLEAGS